MCVTCASTVKSIRVVTFTITQRAVTHGYMMANCTAKAGTKKAPLSLINTKMSCTVNSIGSGIMYHIKHQKTVRAINRANHKRAQSLAKHAKRLGCKLDVSVIFVSKNSII